MTDEQGTRPGPTGFTQGLLAESVQQTEQMVEEWFDELDYKKYGDAYRKLALSGTTGALEALGKQQKGKSSGSNDPVDLTRFLADTWLSSMANAWDASRDLSALFQKDFARYVGVGTESADASSGKTATRRTAKRTAKRAAKKTAKRPAKKTAKKAAKKPAAKSARKAVKKTATKTAARAAGAASARR